MEEHIYRIPKGVQQDIHAIPRPILSTPEGYRVALDAGLLSLWKQADGCKLHEIEGDSAPFSQERLTRRAAIACLVEAGLLLRDGMPSTSEGTLSHAPEAETVSMIIVTYNSLAWLPVCMESVLAQTFQPREITLVDNASSDDTADWVKRHAPHVGLVQLSARHSLAYAINQGVARSSGKYLLVLNPDVRLAPDAVAQMMVIARQDFGTAAVAGKLRLMGAPAFLNGLGNHVGAFSWGTDNGLGHLDLGQFDHWREVSSACFAGALIPRTLWEEVGPLDENFPLYYEDIEWSYRARLLGHTIRAAPQAIVYHAFSGRIPGGDDRGMNSVKLQNVAYGRLRFAIKLLGPVLLLRFLFFYALEDGFGFLAGLLRLNGKLLQAYCNAWLDIIRNLNELLRERKSIQQHRKRTDHELYSLQKQVPPPLIWRGLPELTWDLVQHHYLPLILSGQTRELPEFSSSGPGAIPRPSWWSRAVLIWRNEGWRMLAHRFWRAVQWRLRQV